MKIEKEADLFPIVKANFKRQGYSVYAEVAHFLRGIDLVAVRTEEHIAVELKMSFNDHVVRQAHWNTLSFDKVYIAFPLTKPVLYHNDEVYWKLKESVRNRYDRCVREGIGIYQILPHGLIFEALEAKQQNVVKRMDFTHHKESVEDVGGLPSQKGVSAGYYELENIKDYVRAHPSASWREIFENVHTHYSNHTSLAGAMSQWRGFSLKEFKAKIAPQKTETAELSTYPRTCPQSQLTLLTE